MVRRLDEEGVSPADGLDYELCFGSGDQHKVSLVWDSKEQLDAFGARLMPILAELGIDPGEPEVFEVHNKDVDAYLRGVEEPKRSTLQALRRTILEIIPEAEEVILYRVPAFRVQGKTVAGFAAFKTHLSYLPFSGSVLPRLADDLHGYTMTKSALHFPVDEPLPKALVQKLIAVRLDEASPR